jgi:hypothetical protein
LCSSVEMYDIENALGIEFNEDWKEIDNWKNIMM